MNSRKRCKTLNSLLIDQDRLILLPEFTDVSSYAFAFSVALRVDCPRTGVTSQAKTGPGIARFDTRRWKVITTAAISILGKRPYQRLAAPASMSTAVIPTTRPSNGSPPEETCQDVGEAVRKKIKQSVDA